MQTGFRTPDDDHRPRMIIWQLSSDEVPSQAVAGTIRAYDPFTTHECLVTIDSIARLSRPIVILAGMNTIHRPDLFQIVEYGFALGLKIILEVHPRDLTDELLAKYAQFGPKIFRIMLDDIVVEDMETRFKVTPEFKLLEECVRRVRKAGYELHFGATVRTPDVRALAYEHDYAFRRSAKGLYCHMCFEEPSETRETVLDELDDAIDELVQDLAHMKRLGPKEMYLSPQCIKYGLHNSHDGDVDGEVHGANGNGAHREWRHWCLAARSFAFINPVGVVQACASLKVDCGDLRSNGYNFQRIWEDSYLFQQLRESTQSCTEVRTFMQYIQEHQSLTDEAAAAT